MYHQHAAFALNTNMWSPYVLTWRGRCRQGRVDVWVFGYHTCMSGSMPRLGSAPLPHTHPKARTKPSARRTRIHTRTRTRTRSLSGSRLFDREKHKAVTRHLQPPRDDSAVPRKGNRLTPTSMCTLYSRQVLPRPDIKAILNLTSLSVPGLLSALDSPCCFRGKVPSISHIISLNMEKPLMVFNQHESRHD